MAFDFTNIKAKGKLNGLSSFSSLPAEDDTIKITPIPIDMIDPYTESLHPFKSYTVDKIDFKDAWRSIIAFRSSTLGFSRCSPVFRK